MLPALGSARNSGRRIVSMNNLKQQLLENDELQDYLYSLWRELADRAGLPGLHLVGFGGREWDPIQSGSSRP